MGRLSGFELDLNFFNKNAKYLSDRRFWFENKVFCLKNFGNNFPRTRLGLEILKNAHKKRPQINSGSFK
ncbi:MAG: hypothetical protein A2Y10_08710 [Planctomycetes bacterium GWF2_41_51]|nr:MAG: hypothetical protein A2Y10_08710 [Planctomycetes bacterium GWF2_41_51]HBG28364.1 hypothetical protein [Phycisphaerales bacterium]